MATSEIDPLRERLDAHDRRILREYLKHLVDAHVARHEDGSQQTDEYSEPVVPQTPSEANIRCFVDLQRRRIATTTQEIVPIDVTLYFAPDQQVAVGDVFRNGRARSGRPLFAEVRVVAVDTILHPDRGALVITASCQRH